MTAPRRDDDLDEEAWPATEHDQGLGEEGNSLPEDRTPTGTGEED